MIKFDLKGSKLIFQCDTDLFKQIREQFSYPYAGHSFMKKKNKFIPSRKYVITPTGQCEIGMYWEINKYLHENQIIDNDHIITKELSDYLCKQYDFEFYNTLKANGQPLRDYQVNVVKLALKTGRGICLMGTGAGKTLATAALIENYYLNATNKNAFKCLVVVPDLGLVTQTFNDFLSYGISYKITKWTGSTTPDFTANVIVVNMSILQRRFEENEWLKHIDLLVVDECHKSAAEVSGKIISKITTPHKYGFTGTLPDNNGDKWSVLGKLGPVIYEKNSFELRQENFLVNVNVTCVNMFYNRVPKMKYKEELDFIYNSEFRNNTIKEIAQKFPKNILILINHIRHGEMLLEKLSGTSKKVYFIQGKVEVEERERIKELIEKHDDVVCIALSSIFSTGVNIKNLHMIMFAAGGKAFIRTVQSIGRGLRLHPSKNKLIIFDLIDNLHYGIEHGLARKSIYNREQIEFSEKNLRQP
jgi:superfamily II DNA or RNA helicase